MSISFNRYVRITSGVGGGQGVRQRDLIARLFTSSALISPDTVLEFSDATGVAEYFGATSFEYAMAVTYFGYVSPAISAPQRIAFAACNTAGNDAMVIGNNDFKSITELQGANSGQFGISLDGVDYPVQGIDLTTAISMAAIADLVQTAVRATSAVLAQANVTYGGIRPGGFVLSLPSDSAKISVVETATGDNNLAALLGLSAAVGGLEITGSPAITPVEAVQRSEDISNNFGSIGFVQSLTLTQVTAVASYVNSKNMMYQYHAGVLPADAESWYTALRGFSGTGLTLSPIATEYPQVLPMAILAATNYNNRAATVNYMFRQLGGLTPSVKNNADADKYDALRVNYYGDTSTAGQQILFYQRGTLMGGATAATDMGVFANEQWLKDIVGVRIMSLLLSVGRVPANSEGVASILGVIQECIDLAIFNGTISIGKTLTATQKVYITQQTGDNLAWQTVESAGYVLSCEMQPYVTVSGATEYKAVYRLIYSKDDAVRFVDGTHQLI